MDFNGEWTPFALDAEVEIFGTKRIARAHNIVRDKAEELSRRVAVYEAALVRLRDCDWTISLPDRMDSVRDIAREAIGGGKDA